ncbi:Replicase polyprotein 1ab [Modestobacter muralis]|uniref:Replicase polyprotein 1ab n=1 Tax=Modestobacter muralis TaxID=1608614 RepID=A0A6P0EVX3_9ACTN|nr:Replicase polyprotein 1ab [Modestobacter muralis]NEK95070.1 Replicase polyprotein 1ab [Modestobacter muralis]NEN51958.1 Replicase polyprotein 1ab [Modestobacter muralis]
MREAVGVAAYLAGDFAEAAREIRAYARMSGDQSYRAVLADCERALGRPENALRLVAEALEAQPDEAELVELQLVEAGARQDLGELPAAALILEAALGGRPTPAGLGQPDLGQLRLATAYADLLAARGEEELAMEWYGAIAAADPDDLTGVSDHFLDDEEEDEDDELEAELDGAVLDDDDDAEGDDLPGADADGSSVDEPAVAPAVLAAVADAVAADDDHDDAHEDDDEDDVDEDALDDVADDDIEAEVAELLGEVPPPPVERDHSRLFQQATEQQPPTN